MLQATIPGCLVTEFDNIHLVFGGTNDSLFHAIDNKSKEKVYVRFLRIPDDPLFEGCCDSLVNFSQNTIPGVAQILDFRVFRSTHELYYTLSYTERLELSDEMKMDRNQIIEFACDTLSKLKQIHDQGHPLQAINPNHLLRVDGTWAFDPICPSESETDPIIQIGSLLETVVKTNVKENIMVPAETFSKSKSPTDEHVSWNSLLIVTESMKNSKSTPYDQHKLGFYCQELKDLLNELSAIAEENSVVHDTVRQFPPLGKIHRGFLSESRKDQRTLELLENLGVKAGNLIASERYTGALPVLKQIDALNNVIFESEQIEVIECRAEMVFALLQTGKLIQAYDLAETLQEKILESLPSNERLAKSLSHIASAYQVNGNYALALRMRELYHEYLEQKEGCKPIELAVSLANLSECHRYHCNKKYAKEAVQMILHLIKNETASGDRKSIDCEIEVINVQLFIGKIDKNEADVLKALESAAKIKKKLTEESHCDHQRLATVSLLISRAYKLLKQREKAIEFAEKALELRKKMFSEDDFRLAEALNACASMIGPKNHQKYFKLVLKAKKILKKATKLPSSELFRSYKMIGKGFLIMKKPDQAIYSLIKAKELAEKAFGENHLQIAEICLVLGMLSLQLKDFQTSLENYRAALKIYENMLGELHILSANVKAHLGTVYNWVGYYQTTLEILEPIIDTFKQKYGGSHPKLANLYSLLGESHFKLNDAQEALVCFEKAYEIRKVESVKNNTKLANVMYSLGMIAYQENEMTKAFGNLFAARNIYLQDSKDLDRKSQLIDDKLKEMRNNLKNPKSIAAYYYFQLKYLFDERYFL